MLKSQVWRVASSRNPIVKLEVIISLLKDVQPCTSSFRLAEHATPEILRTPLHELALSIKLLKLGDIGEFLNKAIEPPPLDAVVESVAILKGTLDFNYL